MRAHTALLQIFAEYARKRKALGQRALVSAPALTYDSIVVAFPHKTMQAPDVHHALRIFILVLVASLAMWRCAHVPADIEVPRVTLAGVALEDVTLFEQRYRITLRIHNPNAFGVAIDGVEYRVELNDREFARGVSVANITVPRFGTAVVNVQAVSTLADWLRQIAAGNGEQEDSLSYRIHGKLSLRDPPVKLPFVYHGEITLPAALLGPST